MRKTVLIPDEEFITRCNNAAKLIRRDGLDVLIVNSTDGDYANARYFSNFWPLFERSGVAIAPDGDAALMVGPESKEFGADRSKLKKLFVLREYRESADPQYPELTCATFNDVLAGIGVTGKKLRIGVASFLDTTVVIMEGIRKAFPEAEIVDAGYIMTELRSIKSEAEIACLKEGYRIAEIATQAVINEIRPGKTELEMVGVAQRAIYENGAEYEGLPMYVFSEASTRHCISRSSYRKFSRGDIVQLNLSAKVDGYSASIGFPIVLGKLEGRRRDVVLFGLQVHNWVQSQIKAGMPARDMAKMAYQYYFDNGFGENYVYGPMHGTGLCEVEAPWVETSSNYNFKPGMCFQIDTFMATNEFGVRWEKGIFIRENSIEVLSGDIGTLYELDF
ncbi:MAG: aminopeptidase P family protein [Bacteroidales bacterium]|nr:aminopeptidase P family protein [Bacteroidales bacterium]